MARPRQPTDLLIYKGKKNLTKKEIEERKSQEVKASDDKVEPPTYLPEELKEEFNRIAEELMEIKIMTNLDCEALARFIVSEHLHQKVSVKLLSLKTIGPRFEDLLTTKDKLFKQCRAAASDLGLTISSRCKLVIPKKDDKPPATDAEKRFGDRV